MVGEKGEGGRKKELASTLSAPTKTSFVMFTSYVRAPLTKLVGNEATLIFV